jgi:putative transcriptional regulator
MSRVGKLLIANPNFPIQSPFYKSVVYIYQDDSVNGTVGVILNKQSQTSVSEMCDQNQIMFPDTAPLLYVGGPVNTNSLLMLHSDEWASSNTASAGAGIRISSDSFMFHKIATGNEPIYWRIFAGKAAWRVGQLDKELEGKFPYVKNMWLLADANDDITFNYDGEDQWIKAVDLCSQQTIDHFF